MKKNNWNVNLNTILPVGFACLAILFISIHAVRNLSAPVSKADTTGKGGANTAIEAEDDGIWKDEVVLEESPDMTLLIKEAVLGESQQQKDLVVYTQEISDVIKVVDDGNLPFGWSQKYQYVKYSGTASYSVNLDKIDEDHLKVDEDAKTLTINIPRTVEQLNLNEQETESDETQKVGLLAIGDLQMTEEGRKEVLQNVRNQMTETLKEENARSNADRMAQLSVWEIYQPVVSAVSPEYTVKVEFVSGAQIHE